MSHKYSVLWLTFLSLRIHSLRLFHQAGSKCIPAQGHWHHMATPDDELPLYMQYEWVPLEGCKLARMDLDRFCKFMDNRKFERIFFVGDSLSHSMALSFWLQIGGQNFGQKSFSEKPNEGSLEFEEFDSTQTQGAQFEQTFSCPTKMITFTWHRNDQINPHTKTPEPCAGFTGSNHCYPWWNSYVMNADKTLLLVNTGLHHHSMKSFRSSFDSFFNSISKINAGMVIFRLSVPGHANCHVHTKPFQDESEFKVSGKYQWDIVPDFNAYVQKKFHMLQKPNFKILDVFPMTILRPDGHTDCLHYNVPGVPDW